MTDGTEGIDAEKTPGSTSSGSKGRKAKQQRSFWKELPILILIALVLAFVIKTFFVQAFSIPSESMQNTLQVGDRVLVDKLTPWFGATPERGDVVVFHDPDNWLGAEPTEQRSGFSRGVQDVLSKIGLMPSADEKDLIKRVIAVGGDTVECKPDGAVTVNGKALDEHAYIYPGATPCGDWPQGVQRPKTITVPKHKLWVMGDHRNDSLDSRFHTTDETRGFVPEKDVVGRAFAVAWPINRWSILNVPSDFDGVPSAGGSRAAGAPAMQTQAPLPAAAAVGALLPLAWWRRRSGSTVSRHGDDTRG